MISAPIAPSSGDKISATWMRALVNYVRAIRPIAGPGVHTRETPDGTILTCPIKPRPAAKSTDRGCWNIITGERDGETVHFFGNQFYEDGELMLHELQLEDAVEDFVGQGEPEEGEEYSSADLPFVALKTPTSVNSIVPTELVGFASLAELQAAQVDFSMSIRPLYKFRHDGSVAVDFRNCPNIQVAEALAFTRSSPASGS